MESVVNDLSSFWRNKRVLVTGHTGFKGSWLCLLLARLGARISGFALEPATEPSLFDLCRIGELLEASIVGDVRELEAIRQAVKQVNPEIIIHMAAQPLVRESYKSPVETYNVNVMGTVHVFEAIRAHADSIRAVINVTTDKCYENKEWHWGYRESEALGGYDPYSSSKACSELVTSAYRNSFLQHVPVASARAGNVIGGGDWAEDRLIPDMIRAILNDSPIVLRNPGAIRPWQHVLEPLSGYLKLAQKLYEHGNDFAEAWNFGPYDQDARTVEWIVRKMSEKWHSPIACEIDAQPHVHEAQYLKLDCSKAIARLGWSPRWSLDKTLDKILEWTQGYQQEQDMRAVSLAQIEEYLQT